MRFFQKILTTVLLAVVGLPTLAQWTTTGPFTIVNNTNSDSAFPTSYMNIPGNSQLSIGANWVSGYSDLSLINSNLANTSGGGFSLWQMIGASNKRQLAYFQGNGNVGFGGVIPSRALEVRGENPIFRIGTSAGQNVQVNTVVGGIEFPTAGDNIWMSKINANVGAYSNQPYLTFHTGPVSAEQLRIDQYGNVGIGYASPTARLAVNGDIYSRGHMWLYAYEGEASSGTAYLQARNYMAGTNLNLQLRTQNAGQIVETMHLSSIGNVGIGTTLPVSKLNIVGGGLTLGKNLVVATTEGQLSLGDIQTSSTPTNQSWQANTTLILNGQDYSTIGFHDAGARVDFIRSGNGTIQLGYDGGYGAANIGLPSGIWNSSGNVGIGTTTPGSYKLAVEGKIGAREVEVKVGSWADFVFQPGYQLRPLSEVADYVAANKHLPEIPSEAEVKENGIGLGEMNAKLLQKIEEMTLYMIEQQKQIDQLKRLVSPPTAAKE